MPNLVPNLDKTPIFEGCVLGVALRMDIKKTCVEKRLTLCSRYNNHSRLNSQHN